MENFEIEKSQPTILVELIEYEPQSIVNKTILKKNKRQCNRIVL